MASIFPVLVSLAAALLFGISTPLNKVLLGNINPFTLAGFLYVGAALFLLPKLIAGDRFRFLFTMDRVNRFRLAGSVFFGGVMGPLLLLSALRISDASSVSLWLNLELVFTAVLGHLVFRDYLGRYGALGVALTLAAGVIATVNEGVSGIPAAILAAAACFCWGLDNHFTALIYNLKPWQSTFVKGLAAGAINLALGLIFGENSFSAYDAVSALAIGGICYGGSIVLYITGAQSLGATRSHVIFSAAPFFGFILSILLLGENITLLNIISLLLLAMSVAVIAVEKHLHQHHHDQGEHIHLHNHKDRHHDHKHEGDAGNDVHTHVHRHEELNHSHRHWPDMHHRHEHK